LQVYPPYGILQIMSEIERKIKKVAKLRVQQKTWKECAQAVDKAEDTVRAWQYNQQEKWDNALCNAIDSGLGTYEYEGLTVIRDLVRNAKKEFTRLKAGKALLRHSRERRGIRQEIEHKGENKIIIEDRTE